MSLSDAHAAFTRTHCCPLSRFLSEVLSCRIVEMTEWQECPEVLDTWVREARWVAPLPPDVSETVARLLRVPDAIAGTTVWRLQRSGGELTLLQHSYTSDVLYGDRFKLRSMLTFHEGADGVTVRTFADIIWVTPLPWTHAVVKRIIEKKARGDAANAAGDLARLIQEAAPEAAPLQQPVAHSPA